MTLQPSCAPTFSIKNWQQKRRWSTKVSPPCPPSTYSNKNSAEKTTSTAHLDRKLPAWALQADCDHCGAENSLVYDSECGVCSECAIVHPSTQRFMTPVDYPDRRSHFSLIKKHMYERLVYFKQIINNIRGERGGVIPKEVMVTLKKQFVGAPVTCVTPVAITYALKRMKKTKYNPLRTRIAYHLSNRTYKAAHIEHRYLMMIFRLFTVVEKAYPAVRKRIVPKRKIFFNYGYLFRRLCQIVGKNHYCRDVSRLGSVSARVVQGRLWRAVCVATNLPWHEALP